MNLYGHEGGTPRPIIRKKLIDSILIEKSSKRKDYIEYYFEEAIRLSNDQFFIELLDIKGNITLLYDKELKEPSCRSKDGGVFRTGYLRNTKGKLSKTDFPLLIDVIVSKEKINNPVHFEEVTTALNLPQNLSARSIAWGDINGDGLLDLLAAGRAFTQGQNKTFKELRINKNRIKGITGNALIDMNNDGRLDILIFGKEKSILYVNEGSDQFVEKTLNLPPLPSLSGFSFADLNGDSFLDILLVQLWSEYPIPMPNYLYYNQDGKDFVDQTVLLYPQHVGGENFPSKRKCFTNITNSQLPNKNRNKRSRVCQISDIDGDGDLDIYIGNYFMEFDEYYSYSEKDGFSLKDEIFSESSTNKKGYHTTGISISDLNNNGKMEMVVSHLAHPRSLKNKDQKGSQIFSYGEDRQLENMIDLGIEYEETHAGVVSGDLNNDGLNDLLYMSYYGCRYADLYFQNNENLFENNTNSTGLEKLTLRNDAVLVDFDQDGDLDICSGIDGLFVLLENKTKFKKENWVEVELQSKFDNYNGIGSKVIIQTNATTYTQEVGGGKGQRMQSAARLHYGLKSNEKINYIKVIWPRGREEKYINIATKKVQILEDSTSNLP